MWSRDAHTWRDSGFFMYLSSPYWAHRQHIRSTYIIHVKVIHFQPNLFANSITPIIPPNQRREPRRSVMFIRNRVLSEAMVEPDKSPLRYNLSTYNCKKWRVIIRYTGFFNLEQYMLGNGLNFQHNLAWISRNKLLS